MQENELCSLTVVQMLAGQTHKLKRVYCTVNERSTQITIIVHLLNFLRSIFKHNIQL